MKNDNLTSIKNRAINSKKKFIEEQIDYIIKKLENKIKKGGTSISTRRDLPEKYRSLCTEAKSWFIKNGFRVSDGYYGYNYIIEAPILNEINVISVKENNLVNNTTSEEETLDKTISENEKLINLLKKTNLFLKIILIICSITTLLTFCFSIIYGSSFFIALMLIITIINLIYISISILKFNTKIKENNTELNKLIVKKCDKIIEDHDMNKRIELEFEENLEIEYNESYNSRQR